MASPDYSVVVFPDKNAALNQRVIENLKSLNHPPKQIIVLPDGGIYPEKAAWDWALPRVTEKYVAHVDADMLLDPMSTDRMLRMFSYHGIGVVLAMLRDPVSGREGHLKIWSTDALRRIMASAEIRPNNPDTSAQKALGSLRLRAHMMEWVVGTHAVELDAFNVFRMWLRRGLKHRVRGWVGKPIGIKDLESLRKQNTGWSQIALCAYHRGITLDWDADVHDSKWDEMAAKEYAPVREFCESLAESERQKPSKRRPINVLVAAPIFGLGGAENALVRLLTRLNPEKFKATVVSEDGICHPLLHEQLKAAGVKFEPLGERPLLHKSELEAAWAKYMDANKPEIMMSSSFVWRPAYLYKLALERGIPIIDLSNGRVAPIYFDEIVYEYRLPNADRRGHVIYNGIENDRFVPSDKIEARKKLGIRPEAFVIGAVSRIDPIKNLQVQLKAVRKLVDDGVDAELHVLGIVSDVQEHVLLQKLAATLKIENRVFMYGGVENVPGYLAAFDLVAHTSLSEGAPNALIEAMAMEKPIVTTDVGGIREITNDQATYLSSPATVDELVDALKAVRGTEKTVYATVGRHGMDRFVESVAAVIEKAYRGAYHALPYSSKTKVAFLLGSADDVKAIEAAAGRLSDKVEMFVYCPDEVKVGGALCRTTKTPSDYVRYTFDDGIEKAVVINLGFDPFRLAKPCKVVGLEDLEVAVLSKG